MITIATRITLTCDSCGTAFKKDGNLSCVDPRDFTQLVSFAGGLWLAIRAARDVAHDNDWSVLVLGGHPGANDLCPECWARVKAE